MKPPFEILGTDYVELIVGNARQACHYYQTQFGFEPVAYRGLETGEREKVSYVLQQDRIRLVLTTPLNAESHLNEHLRLHGDGVKDMAFRVDNARAAWEFTTGNGAESVQEPQEIKDETGTVVTAAIHTYGDTIHTFVQRDNYSGVFLPGFESYKSHVITKGTGLKYVDHFVGNQPENKMQEIAEWYEKVFGFTRFWTVDDKDISTEFTALRSIVMVNDNMRIKMPINRPATGRRKSQIQEFVEFYNGPGVQHIAMTTDNIIETVARLHENGVEFLETPQSYYDVLTERVGEIDEEIKILADLRILVDRDEKGYLLQIFTKPVQDRPTLFYEIIQRKGSESFGKGNFQALFESIEREQARRGNL